MKRKLWVALAAAVVGLPLIGLATQLERAETPEPWLDPLPEYAVKRGYWSFRQTQGGWALRGYADTWLAAMPPDPQGPLLIDRRHATKQPEDAVLGMTDYGYSRMHGLSRAFRPFTDVGGVPQGVSEPWTPGRLEGASAVFINLVSGDNPGFRHSEVLALEAFVRNGGGLILITDHTNCYFHAEMLQPLTQRLGIEVVPATACELPPNTLSPSTRAWVKLHPMEPHPVGQDVHVVGWMTGGIVRPAADSTLVPVVGSTETGWEDALDPYKKAESAGFTGSLKQTDDEPNGPHPTIIAGQVGKGRVVVLADQNAWGATLIGYEDNGQVFANTLQWVTQRELPYEARGPGSVTTFIGPRSLCTAVLPAGFRTLQVQAQRLSQAHDVPVFCTQQGETASSSLVVLPEADRADLADQVRGAERALILVDADHTELIEALGIQVAGVGEPAATLQWQRDLAHPEHPVFDDAPAVETLAAQPVLLEGDWTPLLVDDLGQPVVVQGQVDGTELTLVLDASILTNGVLGLERERPHSPPDRENLDPVAMAAGQRIAFTLLHPLFVELTPAG